MLAQLAEERQPTRWSPPPHVYHELRQRLVVRDGLLTMRQQARNQRHALQQWSVTIPNALEAVIAAVDSRISTLDEELATVLHDGTWAASAVLLDSISGIGLVTTAWLLVGTLNFTTCASTEAAGAYVGLVTLARDSGTSVPERARIGPGGNARVRTALYSNPGLEQSQGRPGKGPINCESKLALHGRKVRRVMSPRI